MRGRTFNRGFEKSNLNGVITAGLTSPLFSLATILCYEVKIGAGDGNRTHATSLEGWSSTIELHPQL